MIDEGVILTAVVVPCVGALVYAIKSIASRSHRFTEADITVIDARVLLEVSRVISLQKTVVVEALSRNNHRRAIEVLDEAEAEVKAKALFLAERLARR
jgi:hypothetical protein